MMISPSAVHSTKQSSYCWQKATNSSSVMGTRLGFRITGAIDSKSSTTSCMCPVYCQAHLGPDGGQLQNKACHWALAGDALRVHNALRGAAGPRETKCSNFRDAYTAHAG